MIFFFFSFFLFVEFFFLSWNLTEETVFFQIMFFILLVLTIEIFRNKTSFNDYFFNKKCFLVFQKKVFDYGLFLRINLFKHNVSQIYFLTSNFLFFRKLVLILSSFNKY